MAPQNMHEICGNRLEFMEFLLLHSRSVHFLRYIFFKCFFTGVPAPGGARGPEWFRFPSRPTMYSASRPRGGGEWLRFPISWAKMSIFGALRSCAECGARRECGVRSAAGRCLRSRPVSAEPADVCGVRRVLSADRVQSADCRVRGRPAADAVCGARNADSCGVRRFFLYNLGRQFYLGRQGW